MALARALAAIASAANAPAIGFDLDLNDEGVFLEAKRSERQATARTTGLLGSKDTFLGDEWQVGIISAVGNLLARLLAAASWWCSRGCSGGGSLRGRGSVLGERVSSRRTRQVIGRVPRLTLGAE
jgi:hypothetical protein